MTITANDIVTRAFRRLGIKAEDESLTADQIAHGLDVLNAVMAGLRLRGVNYTHAEMRAGDEFPLGVEFSEPLVTLLADALAPDYAVAVRWDAESAMRLLQSNLYPKIEPLRSAPELLRRSPTNGWLY
jgi:hypothetical protein